MKSKLSKILNQLKKELSSAELDGAFSQISNVIEQLAPTKETASAGEFKTPPQIVGKNALAVFSDGACRGNPGPGSWGYLIQDESGKVLTEQSGMENPTTNNQMEMMGAIKGLETAIENEDFENFFLFTDSQYIVKGMNEWLEGWKKRGWKKADKKAPENLQLWQRLDSLAQDNSIFFHWVKGHSGHPQNERCDELANMELDRNGH